MIRTDGELLAAHLAGDPHAFAELADRLMPRLWLVARHALDSQEDAAEAVQDALIRAHQGAGGFRAESSVYSWVLRILVNICLDRRRRNSIRTATPLPSDDFDELPSHRDPIAERELRLDVWQALAGLPPEQRLPIVLVDMQGYATAEAAALLGIPVGTVKSRCARGRLRLAEQLGHLRTLQPAQEHR
ncbi:MAG: RNA polymerase sigma factor SigM [Pseudonocardia sp.]|nr:RNA polymerase sigma factor SigM [Pseudonocardia sp.]